MASSRKKRPYYGRIFLSLLILIGLIAFFVKLGMDLFWNKQDTYLTSVGTLSLENNYQAFVLRNELVVDTELQGEITYFANEGAYVIKGDQVAEIANNGESQAVSDEENDRKIAQKQIEFDYNQLEYEIGNLKTQILFALSTKDYGEIPNLKNELLLRQERLGKLEEENKFLSNRNEDYFSQTIGSGVLLEGQKQLIGAPANGVVTYYVDGYESALAIDNVYTIDYDALADISFSEQTVMATEVSQGATLFKIVDTTTYYLAAVIDAEDLETYRNIQGLEVRINGSVYTGEVYDSFLNDAHGVVIVRLNEAFDDFYKKRQVDVTFVRQNYRGIRIYADSIVNLEGQIGVYAVGEDQRLAFVPVKVIGYDDIYAIVYNEQFYDAAKGGVVRSLSLNQTVVRNGSAHSAGQRVE